MRFLIEAALVDWLARSSNEWLSDLISLEFIPKIPEKFEISGRSTQDQKGSMKWPLGFLRFPLIVFKVAK
jgi:hypothetical protein